MLSGSGLRTYLRLFRFALPYKWRFAAALACMSVLAAATAAYVNLLGPTLDFLFTGRTGAVQSLSRLAPRWLDVDGFLAQIDRAQMLAVLPLVIVAIAGVKGLAYFGQAYLMAVGSQRITADIRRALFDRLVRLPPAFHARHHSGDLIARFSGDVTMVQLAIGEAIATYVRDGLTVVVMLANCFILDWKLSLISFGAIPATLVPVIRLSKRLRRNTGQSVATGGRIAEIALEAVAGIRVIQSFCAEAWESARFAAANRRWLKFERRIARVRSFSSPLMEVMAAVGLAAAIWWVGGRILSGQLEAGKFFSFIAAVLLLYQPVKQLGRVGQTAILGAVSGQRLFEIIDAESSVPDRGTVELPPLRQAIRYEGVHFSYGDRPVLRGLDLEIRRGEVVALVGPSGGGKTTIANLLPRFWDVGSGRITFDGTDVREATQASLRAQIAVVGQETVLFNETVRANIAYGRADVAQDEIERAARVAQAHDFISQLPQGYDTPVGERGVLLSGGQRQRIAIARAVVKNAPVLVLDEATSALDAESEREVQRALDALMADRGGRDRTTLVIAHRLSTIRNADRIAVVVDGRVAETGRHDELLARRGEYARLWKIFEGATERDGRAVPA
ncbi:MAG TPA: ABC transporter transmembrane domain-containing protein [Anaeromyxobacter sp.]|nr:ABC transporter transmembrane domain-containing protein [Anaeromyxobacter sp.]